MKTELVIGESNKDAVAALKSNARMVWLEGPVDTGKTFLAKTLRPDAELVDPVDETLTAAKLDNWQNLGKRVTLISLTVPRDAISDDRVRVRCCTGLIVRLMPWDETMRRHLLLKNAPTMPAALSQRLAHSITGGPRIALGLASGWKGRGMPTDEAGVAELLRAYGGRAFSREFSKASAVDVMTFVAERLGTTMEWLCCKARTKHAAWARHVAIFMVKDLCPHETLSTIGQHFGGRDHSTVLHALNKMRSKVARDKGIADELAAMKQEWKTKHEQS